MMRRFGWTVAIACMSACGVDLAVPDDARILCQADRECPSGMACDAGLGTCALVAELDRAPPRLLAVAVASPIAIVVTFDERVAREAAEDITSYSASPPLAFTSATLGEEGQSVVLGVERQDAVVYALVVDGVTDASGNRIAAPNDRGTFTGVPTAPDTQPPELLLPTAGQRFVERDAVDLLWTPRDGASSYIVDVTYDEAMLQPIPGSPFVVTPTKPGGVPEPTLRLTRPQPVTFYWTVRADVTVGDAASSYFEAVSKTIHVYCPQLQACSDAGRAGNVTHPFGTIGRAIAVAAEDGLKNVFVAARGASTPYFELVALVPGVNLYGGYDQSFTTRNAVTAIRNDGSVTVYAEDIDTPTVVDGFTIEGGSNSVVHAVEALRASNLTLSNDIITGGTASEESIAVDISDSGSRDGVLPLITGCTIASSPAGRASIGISTTSSSIVVQGSEITAGDATAPFTSDSLGMRLQGGAVVIGNIIRSAAAQRFSVAMRLAINELGVASRIEGNIVGTGSSDQATGITVSNAARSDTSRLLSPVVSNNVIDVIAGSSTFGVAATGIYAHRGAVTNNTVVLGTCPAAGCTRYGMNVVAKDGELVVANNVIAMNGGTSATGACLGIDTSPQQQTHPPARLENNLLVECPESRFVRLYDIAGSSAAITTIGAVNQPSSFTVFVATPPTSATGNFSEAAMAYFEDPANGDYHWNASTTATVKGSGLDASGPTYGNVTSDLDGSARTCAGPGACYSVGAYELD